jgi:hypothetical protein
MPVASLLAMVLSCLMSGCTGANHPERVLNSTSSGLLSSIQGHYVADDGITQFRSRGPIDVVVDSFAGDVSVHANPNIDVTTVQVVRVSQHGYLRGSEPREALQFVDWLADLTPGPGPVETLRVNVDFIGPEPWFMRAHLYIETPSLDRVTVRTTNGDVSIRNNTGPLDIQTNMGDVTIASNNPLVDASTVLVVEGNVDYRVPGNSSGMFDVEVIDGDIEIWVPEGRWRYVSRTPQDDTIKARLNDGENPILLRASEGDIRIAVVPDPMSYGPIR